MIGNNDIEIEIDPQDKTSINELVSKLGEVISSSSNVLNKVNNLEVDALEMKEISEKVSIEYTRDMENRIKIKKLKFAQASTCIYYDDWGNPHKYNC
jgi:CRISPR/Cas system CMR-associated protein Cmr5 small subunit